jgi:hypothetical protein
MMGMLTRLRNMPREEWAWRLRTLARMQRQRLSVAVRPPQWERGDLCDALAPAVLDAEMRCAIEDEEWTRVQERLQQSIADRPSRFVLHPHAATSLRSEVLRRWPDAGDAARTRADRILAGRFDLLGYRDLRVTGTAERIDWHLDPLHGRWMPKRFWASVPYLDPRFGDHKIIWEINRHQHWLALGRALWLTGEQRFADAIVDQLESWLAANPPLIGVNWASMLELGFRSMSWTWALHFLAAPLAVDRRPPHQPWLADMLVGLHHQLTHLAHNLSYYFSPNTHLTGEALALYVVGHAIPELRGSAEWIDTGRRVLLAEIDRQVAADGGHAERSTHYHRYTLDFYLLALLTAERNGDDEAAAVFADVAARLARFMAAMCDDRGRFPQIGDDDGGMLWPIAGREAWDVRDSLALAAVALDRPELAPWGVPEETFWIAWSAKPSTLRVSDPLVADVPVRRGACAVSVFPETGYVTMRDRDGGHLVFDVGPHGYLNGGHAHADALAVTLAVGGRPLLIDPGTATYTMDPALRDRMRRTASHNTLAIDNRSSSVTAGPFHWASRADGRLNAVRRNPGFGWAEGIHDGFAGVRHRRTVVRGAGSGWLVVDEVLGRGPHRADLYWHFDPAWSVTCTDRECLRATAGDGEIAWMLHDGGALSLVHGDEESGLGWCSPMYGALVPTWTGRISRIAEAPFALVTWLGDGGATVPSLRRLDPRADCEGHAIAVQVVRDGVTWMTLLRPGEPAGRETRSCGVTDYHSNARLLQYGIRDGRLVALTAADFSDVLATRDGMLSITADGFVTDLHAAIAGSVLELWCSAPAVRIRMQGGVLGSVRTIRLNGIDQPCLPADDTIVVAAADWTEPETELFDRNTSCVA